MDRIVLTDCEHEIWHDDFSAKGNYGESGSWSVSKRTLRGGTTDGIDVVAVDNGCWNFETLPTRGMGLWRGQAADIRCGWRSPVQRPVHPRHVTFETDGHTGWLRGFCEWMCRAGLESIGDPADDPLAMGGPRRMPLHGRIANTPAHYVAVDLPRHDSPRIVLRGAVDECVLFGPKLRLETESSIELGQRTLHLRDRITNLGSQSGEFQLMFHANFGAGLLEEGAQILVPASEIAPYDEHAARHLANWSDCGPPRVGYQEQCFFLRPLADSLGRGSMTLCNARGDRGVRLRFFVGELPCCTVWKHLASHEDGYVVGLEPGTSYPNPKPFERSAGRVPLLAPGESREISLSFEALVDAEQVAAARREAEELQQTQPLREARERPGGFSALWDAAS